MSNPTVKVHPAIPIRNMVMLAGENLSHQDCVGGTIGDGRKPKLATQTVEAATNIGGRLAVTMVRGPSVAHIQVSGGLTPLLVGVGTATTFHALGAHAADIVKHLIVQHVAIAWTTIGFDTNAIQVLSVDPNIIHFVADTTANRVFYTLVVKVSVHVATNGNHQLEGGVLLDVGEDLHQPRSTVITPVHTRSTNKSALREETVGVVVTVKGNADLL